MQEKRKGSCLKMLLIFLFIIVLLLGSLVLLLKHFVTGSSDDTVTTSFAVHNADEAIRQLERMSDEFGYENALSELIEKTTVTIDGDSYYRLQQNYQGVPVYGKTVVCVTDKNSQVMFISGNVVDVDNHIDMIPSITKNDALKSIKNYVNQYSDLNIEDITDVSLDSKKFVCTLTRNLNSGI